MRQPPALHGPIIIVLAILLLAQPTGPVAAQQCAVGVVGPFSLSAKQDIKVCGNNFLGTVAVSVGVATFDALDARVPLDLRFVRLAPREGACLLVSRGATRTKAARDVLVQTGVVLEADAVPPELSVQRVAGDGDVDAADYVVWRRDVGDGPLV